MSRSRVEPFFVERDGVRLFALLRSPEGAHRCLLFVPPFGEEMNKCRRQISVTAQRLAERGYATLTFDLRGTGDSSGDLDGSDWDAWKQDVAAAVDAIERNGLELDSIVGLRLGCALAADSLASIGRRVRRSVFWQPVDSGRRFMSQFLRLRTAASMMDEGEKETVEQLRARLARGEPTEVAGYRLPPGLWRSVENVELSPLLSSALGGLAVFEVGRTGASQLSPPARALLNQASENGIEATGKRFSGEPFWSSTEIVVNSDVATETAVFLTGSQQ